MPGSIEHQTVEIPFAERIEFRGWPNAESIDSEAVPESDPCPREDREPVADSRHEPVPIDHVRIVPGEREVAVG